MNIVVSGASGYLGNKLVARFCESGHRVLALTRTPNKPLLHYSKKYGNALEICELDVDDLFLCLTKFSPDVIFSTTCCYETDSKFLNKTVAANYIFPASLLKFAVSVHDRMGKSDDVMMGGGKIYIYID